MKKFALAVLMVVSVVCLAATAFAGALSPGQSTKCDNASSISLAVSGGDAVDRGNGNAVIWKSSNFTTIPITLGPNEVQNFQGGAAGAEKSGIKDHSSLGRSSVTLMGQENFSRGDSIGDISGEVRITNTGTTSLNVSCG